MKSLHKVAFLLLVVGGLSWGLIGLFGLNLVMAVFGSWPNAERLVYVLVGLAAVFEVASHMDLCRECGAEMMKPVAKKKGRR